MGGQKSYSSKSLLGNSKSVNESKEQIKLHLESKNNEDAALQVLNLLVKSDSTIQAIFLTVKVLKLAYDIYVITEEEYQKSGDYETSLSNAFFSVLEKRLEGKKQIVIENGIAFGWNHIKEKNSIETRSEEVDEIVISAITEVIMENIQ